MIDKDFAGALLATSLHADAFLMLTDVDAVYADWGTPAPGRSTARSPEDLASRSFAAGSMGPKVEAACRFVRDNGGFAAIGSLADAGAMLRGEAGTIVTRDAAPAGVGDGAAAGRRGPVGPAAAAYRDPGHVRRPRRPPRIPESCVVKPTLAPVALKRLRCKSAVHVHG